MRRIVTLVALALVLAACGDSMHNPSDACSSGCSDAGDASPPDVRDTGTSQDTGRSDGAGSDANVTDGAIDGSGLDVVGDARDAMVSDVPTDRVVDGPADVVDATDVPTTTDTGSHDSGTGGCVSGASGRLAVRFQWAGSGAGSTAYVRYLANDLPDTSRWHVSANDMSFSYTPIFDDTFLGVGGLDLEGTAFMDVELSTLGLSSISNVTIAMFGRSFDTTTDGSYSWQTFTGVGAAPTDLVSNVAPYQWYLADATTEFVPGDGGVLLRIRPGPSSNALIVNTVEICFDAI